VCEKNLPYELTASFLLTADAPGVPKPIKLQAQHRALFPLDKPITRESGKQIALWAAGGNVDWAKEIKAADSPEKLAGVWARIPRSDKPKYEAAKDQRKAELQQPQQEEEAI
jgi:hypothetical protein